MNTEELSGHTLFKIHLKGDGKQYQFRAKSSPYQGYSYVTTFQTSGEWEIIEINTSDLRPSFRGRSLDLPNYDGESLAEIGFLIGNKKMEDFSLLIDKVVLH